MQYEYQTQGTCSQKILFEVNDDIVTNIRFIGGCHGNTQGVSLLADGRNIDELIRLLKGVRCGYRPTSCPDQLARALIEAKNSKA